MTPEQLNTLDTSNAAFFLLGEVLGELEHLSYSIKSYSLDKDEIANKLSTIIHHATRRITDLF